MWCGNPSYDAQIFNSASGSDRTSDFLGVIKHGTTTSPPKSQLGFFQGNIDQEIADSNFNPDDDVPMGHVEEEEEEDDDEDNDGIDGVNMQTNQQRNDQNDGTSIEIDQQHDDLHGQGEDNTDMPHYQSAILPRIQSSTSQEGIGIQFYIWIKSDCLHI
jgi:hypothetical protein